MSQVVDQPSANSTETVMRALGRLVNENHSSWVGNVAEIKNVLMYTMIAQLVEFPPQVSRDLATKFQMAKKKLVLKAAKSKERNDTKCKCKPVVE
ncbi:hypothetical protein PR048_021881, partial [Dryococelus australis]